MAKPIQGTQTGDTLYGTSGNDKLLGHQGDDFFDLRQSTGSDTIDGQGGMDTAIFAGRYEDYVFSFKDTGNLKTTVDGHGLSADLKQVETLWFDNATVDVATHTARVTTVSIANAVAVNEGDTSPQLAFTLTRTGDLSRSLDVAYTLDGTATAGSDYTAPASYNVHFNEGSATATLSLAVINDAVFEGSETVGVHLVADSHYNFAAGAQVNASGTILDNDPPPVTAPVLHVSNASAVEGGNLVFHVSIAAPTDHNITFQAFQTPEPISLIRVQLLRHSSEMLRRAISRTGITTASRRRHTQSSPAKNVGRCLGPYADRFVHRRRRNNVASHSEPDGGDSPNGCRQWPGDRHDR